MLKKWFEIIFDHRTSLQERMFRVVTGICMVALMIILPMGRSLVNLLILAVSLLCITVVSRISIQKQCINTGATVIAVLLLLLFPVSFFTAGGFYSGMPEWFVLCFIYISVTLTGRRRVGFLLLCAAEILLCYYVAFQYPELVARSTDARSFSDSSVSVIMVGMLSSILLMFLNLSLIHI